MGRSAEHVDVVVVGSGFGGSVTAFRFAESGASVVVLERGKAYPPGSFPRTPAAMSDNFWDPSEGRHGLFDVWSFRNFEAVVSSGLGGGSLIYANVLLRKDAAWFVHDAPPGEGYESWPVTAADLDEHYSAVESMIGVQRFPKGQPGYQASRRTEALERAGRELGYTVQQPPLAVSFSVDPKAAPVPGAPLPEPGYGNLHGLPRTTCVLCGECDLGCNTGSKNTMDHTYLSAARHHGADLRVRHEVRSITPRAGGGYTVGYVVHEPGTAAATTALPERRISCDRLVLAAGSFGTTYLLLRNRAALPGLSRQLGRRFSGNGDFLGFVRDAAGEPLGSSRGPVITTAVRSSDVLDGVGGHRSRDRDRDRGRGRDRDLGRVGATGRGFYVEDAGYPGFVEWLLEASALGAVAGRLASAVVDVVRMRLSDSPSRQVGDLVGDLLGGGAVSGGAMPLLGMGRDLPTGVMSVRDDYLQIEDYPESSEAFFDQVRDTMAELAEQLGGEFGDNLLTRLSRVVTVHPLGGAAMGRDVAGGVVDEWGEVFGHPGLYVADGAAMPGPVGANPSLTIAAFADRLAVHAVETARRQRQPQRARAQGAKGQGAKGQGAKGQGARSHGAQV